MSLIIASSVLFLLLRLPSLFEPYWYGDEGIYLVLGQAIRKGLILYSQIHDNKPPTLYYFAALGQTVFGFRLLLLLWLIPTLYVFYLLARKLLKPPYLQIAFFLFLILSSIPLIEGHIANAEIFMLLPTVLAAYLIQQKINTRNLFLSGLLLGFAFTIKVPAAADALFLGIWILFFHRQLRQFTQSLMFLLPFGIGFLLPISLWAVYFWFQGALSEFTFAALLQNFGYLSSWSTGSHSGSATSGGLLTRLMVLFLSFILIYFLRARRLISAEISFTLLWFSSAIFGALLSSRPYPHYLIQVIPSLTLLISYLISRRYYLLLPLIIFGFILSRYQFYYYPVFSYYRNFYSYVLHRQSQEDYRRFFGHNIPSVYTLSEYISQNTASSDSIYIWGDEPYVYALSDRLPVGRYTVAYHVVDFNGYDETIKAFKAVSPKLIIYYQMSGRSFPKLDQYISRYYTLTDKIGPALIFKIR